MTTLIKNNVIDSRDVTARIDDLEYAFQVAYDDYEENFVSGKGSLLLDQPDLLRAISDDPDHNDQYDALELLELCDLRNQCENYGSWRSGETLIRRSHFVQYIRDMAYGTNAISDNDNWPYNHIDWDAAAGEREADYMEATFDGETFLMRA